MAVSRRKEQPEGVKSPDYAAVGEMLRDTRTGYGLSLEQAAQFIHVKPAVLAALEKGRLEDIPGGLVYAKGHLRSYAHYLGVNLSTMLNLLTVESEVKPMASVSMAHAEPKRTRLAAAISLAVIVGIAAILLLGSEETRHEATLVKPPPGDYNAYPSYAEDGATPGFSSPCISVSEHAGWPPCFGAEEERLLRRLQPAPLNSVLQITP